MSKGNCVELEADGQRILFDLGLFISHPHPDHYGLLESVAAHVPVYMGDAARRIIEVSGFFTPLPTLGDVEPLPYQDLEPIELGPFKVTPFAMDHSAFDSHAFLIEVGGKRIFYSGDLRAHGRKSHLFEGFVANPPANINVLICEGTQIGRKPDFAFPDEGSVAKRMAEYFDQAKGMGLVWCSGQNIDRVVSVFEAAKRSGRNLILDVYAAEILRATSCDDVPQPGKDGVKVFLPFSQKNLIVREKAFHISNKYYPHRIYPDELADAASDSVMLFRPSMLKDLKRAECLNGAVLISSVWSGYLPSESKRIDEMKSLGIEHHHVHTSGHATVDELQRFIDAFPDSRIVPVHLEDRAGFEELSDNVELRNDHEWWEV